MGGYQIEAVEELIAVVSTIQEANATNQDQDRH
jgi:hypothetical protein